MSQGTEVVISEKAARRIATVAAKEGKPGLMLRITVSGGGCSGFKYAFSFDDATLPDDVVFERDGSKVVTDTVSLDFIRGSEVDFVEEMLGSYFAVRNPNAKSSCGCGNSFALKN